MTNRQKELISFCGYKIVGNRLIGEKESIQSIYYDEKTGLFSIDIKAYNFKPGDYETIEMFSISLNHMLGLIYELNHIAPEDDDIWCKCGYEGNSSYVENYLGERHGWICPKCHKYTQVG